VTGLLKLIERITSSNPSLA